MEEVEAAPEVPGETDSEMSAETEAIPEGVEAVETVEAVAAVETEDETPGDAGSGGKRARYVSQRRHGRTGRD